MKTRTIKYLLFIGVTLSILSCQQDSQPLLPSIVGRPGEIAVVITKGKWNGEIGEKIRSVFGESQVALPQDEPMFDLLQTNYDNYTKLFAKYRNILIIRISSDAEKPKILIQRDVSAKPQLIINLIGKNNDDIMQLLQVKEDLLRRKVLLEERKRLSKLYETLAKKEVVNSLYKKHDVMITIPKGYSLDVDSSNFAWIAQDQGEISKNILLYYYPVTNTEITTADIIAKRKMFCKKYVPGGTPGSYVTTELEYPPIFTKYKTDNDRVLIEMRGLWKMANGISMGGPFVSVTTLDSTRNRMVTAEGFVFAPGKEKRNFIRELEAIIYSLDFE